MKIRRREKERYRVNTRIFAGVYIKGIIQRIPS